MGFFTRRRTASEEKKFIRSQREPIYQRQKESTPYPLQLKTERDVRRKEASRQARRKFFTETFPSLAKRSSSGIGGFISGLARAKRERMIYARDVRKSIIGSGQSLRGRYGRRGRPTGPSGKYYIPGYGPVGVYEYRMWLRQSLRQKNANLQQQMTLDPEQRNALAILRARQRARYVDPENKVIPDTTGKFNLKDYQDEIDESSNIVP